MASSGSSPQVRGTSARSTLTVRQSGIIPAGAGHFRGASRRAVARWDHPRRCGALFARRRLGGGCAGSSPQVRGTYNENTYPAVSTRIIPAGAGHFRKRLVMSVIVVDHPRRCGAFPLLLLLVRVLLGSSPQVRGIYSLSWNIDPKYSSLTPSYR